MDMPNLCLRDPGHTQYSEASVSNLLNHNYSSSVAYSDALAGNTQPQKNSVELPIATTMISQGSIMRNPNMVTSRIGEHACNSWKDGKNEMFLMQTAGVLIDDAEVLLNGDDPQWLNGQSLSLQQSDVSTIPSQGLSLSLSTQNPVPSLQYRSTNSDVSLFEPHQSLRNGGLGRDENYQNKRMHANNSQYRTPSLASTILNSKYLKATQELLDEVVNVQKALNKKSDKSQNLHTSVGITTDKDGSAGSKGEGMPSNPEESAINSFSKFSPSERQDLQNKVTKLLAMLDEVGRKYKQYYHRMQIVVSSFDIISGSGAAKPYTTLALQTISEHFCCLGDAISGQIQVTRKSLGEPDNSGGNNSGISRIHYIDQQLRKQRPLQQFGMMQHRAWRPQRGLPESSVSILRDWLFEHFLHPYPNDSEKLMLARRTGLMRSQVSNWFINARVRLWKPMIEDMYKEELGDIKIDSNSSLENLSKFQDDILSSGHQEDLQNTATERCQTNQFSNSSKSNIIPAMDIAGAGVGFQHEVSVQDSCINLKMRTTREDSSFLQDALAHPDENARFMAYQMVGGVSLTLGLQHCDGGLPASNNQQSFLGVQMGDIYSAAAPVGVDAVEYDYASAGERRYQFGSSHLLHDFVA